MRTATTIKIAAGEPRSIALPNFPAITLTSGERSDDANWRLATTVLSPEAYSLDAFVDVCNSLMTDLVNGNFGSIDLASIDFSFWDRTLSEPRHWLPTVAMIR